MKRHTVIYLYILFIPASLSEAAFVIIRCHDVVEGNPFQKILLERNIGRNFTIILTSELDMYVRTNVV